ncbi:hypothetical protein WIW50_20685 [Flavobacteriaceae bacterium 3-367]
MKNNLFRGLLLSGILTFSFSCTQDESIKPTQELIVSPDQTEGPIVSSITLADLEIKLKNADNYVTISSSFDVNAKKGQNGLAKDGKIYELDTDEIIMVETGEETIYTLRVENSDGIENVLLEEVDGSLNARLLSYDFSGEVSLDDEGITIGHFGTTELLTDEISGKGASTARSCYTVTLGFPYPCDGGPNHLPGETCTAAQQPGYLWYTTSVCTDGPSPGFGAPIKLPRECTALQCSSIDASSGGGGGGSGTGGGGFGGGDLGDSTVPIIDDEGNSLWEVFIEGSINLLDSRLNLTFLEENYLAVNNLQIQPMLDFLHINNWSSYSKAQAKKIISAKTDRSIVTDFPLVTYPKDKAAQYKRDYPHLTNFLETEVPKIADNAKVINSIHGLTDAPIEKIKEALEWGKGPEIEIKQLGTRGGEQLYGKYDGHVIPENVNTLFLDIDLVNDLENLDNSQDFRDEMAFLIAVTILHEYTHLGDTVFGDQFWGELHAEDQSPENEVGWIFEEEVFGESVWRSNVGVVMRKSKLY